jgi:hypothetical protein
VKRPSGEFDFWIISAALRVVVQIEAKRSNSIYSRDSAKKQLEKGFTFLKENLSFPEEEKWMFVRTVCFDDDSFGSKCDKCKHLFLHKRSQNFSRDLEQWWQSISHFSNTNGERALF